MEKGELPITTPLKNFQFFWTCNLKHAKKISVKNWTCKLNT